MKQVFFVCILYSLLGCKEQPTASITSDTDSKPANILHATGFTVTKEKNGHTVVTVTSPWPNAGRAYKYLLVSKKELVSMPVNKNAYDAIIPIPVASIVVSSTTHIPALESLGVLESLVGFPDTKYISSKAARTRIRKGLVKELGKNELLNTEAVLALQPDLVVGFSLSSDHETYKTLQHSNIPVVYNGDWVEETPLGKAEWIKFFAPFFEKEKQADSIFKQIETSYLKAKKLAKTAESIPTVLAGAMYKDIWYLPGGNSWAAAFIKDANAQYLWNKTLEKGSISLHWETVLQKANMAEFWIAPGQFTSLANMKIASPHYHQFKAFQNKKVFNFTNTVGDTGGILYYELAPQRPDLVLKDLIHIFHPELQTAYEPTFFKPLK